MASSITEGSATIYSHVKGEVFYNPAQIFNRDLSIYLLNQFLSQSSKQKVVKSSEKVSLLEGMSATGLRSIRYAQECPLIDHITANDLEKEAFNRITENATKNGISPDTKVKVNLGDVNEVMHNNKYTVIDLDPYGSVSMFIDEAVKSIQNGGLLMITCTDSAVLNGNNTGTCFLRYGGIASAHGRYGHEAAIRLIINAIAQSAAKIKRGVIPLACFSIDFYYRLFIKVVDSPAMANELVGNTGIVHQCVGCDAFEVVNFGRKVGKDFKQGRLPGNGNCNQCDSAFSLAGPFWTGPIYDEQFIDSALLGLNDNRDGSFIKSWGKIEGLLYGLKSELREVPLFYQLSSLCHCVKIQQMKLSVFYQQVKLCGFKVSGSHREPGAIKTSAPVAVLFDILRCYVKRLVDEATTTENEPKKSKKSTSPQSHLAQLILSKPVNPEVEAKLDFSQSCEDLERPAIYLPNPEKNWGPKPAAKKHKST
jgi:tRNA (guanine26-N2/guanine27-N2)-dimethyltransferase